MKSKELSEKAMLVNLHISNWSGRKYDRRVSDMVAEEYGAKPESGRYNKCLVAKDAIGKVQNIAVLARNFHYENTLPWTDEGSRILPVKNFDNYSNKLRKYRSQYEDAVQEFCEIYPTLKSQAKDDLGELYNPDDYPSPADIPGKFDFRINISPLPVSDDFRVALNEEDVSKIKDEIEERLKDAQDKALKDLWHRLYDVVDKVANRLSEPDRINKKGEIKPPVFRKSLIGNVVELVELLPKLNVTDDPRLEELRKEVEKKLAGVVPADLREDSEYRKQTAQEAKEILNKMSGYVGDISEKKKVEEEKEEEEQSNRFQCVCGFRYLEDSWLKFCPKCKEPRVKN